MNILSIISLIVIALLSYFIINKLISRQNGLKRKRLSQVLSTDEKNMRTSFTDWLDKKGVLRYLSPAMIMAESETYGKKITVQSFVSSFILGVLIGLVIIFVYFQPFIYLFPLALIGGVVAVNMKLHKIKKEYVQLLDSKISIYMSSIATSMRTFGNIRGAMQSVLPTLEEPIKNDVEKALISLQDGKEVRVAFGEMNRKYNQKELTHFHDQLDIIVKGGAGENDTLRNLAFKMKKKSTYRRKLQTAHRGAFKVWKTFVFLTLSVPFLFLFVSFDNFLLIMNSPLLSLAFLIALFLIAYTYRKLEQLEVYDPTSDQNITF